MSRERQSGFSLLELLVAMMILAVIGTVGFTQFRAHAGKARYIKAKDTLQIVGNGLDQYYLKVGVYPDISSYATMVEANSPLVKQNLIPPNVPAVDPWGQPYEGKSSKGGYVLNCLGDPVNQEDHKPFTIEPGRLSDSPTGPAAGAGTPAGDLPK